MFRDTMIFEMTKEKNFNAELFFAALADRTRLRLLNMLGDAEVCVCFFAEVLETNQPKISRHLAYLKRAGLVAARRDGKWMHYRVTAPQNKRAAAVFAAIMEMLKADRQMRDDRRSLMKACCLASPPQRQPVSIKGTSRRKKIRRKMDMPAPHSG